MADCFACSLQKREPYANLTTLSNHELCSVPLGSTEKAFYFYGGERGWGMGGEASPTIFRRETLNAICIKMNLF